MQTKYEFYIYICIRENIFLKNRIHLSGGFGPIRTFHSLYTHTNDWAPYIAIWHSRTKEFREIWLTHYDFLSTSSSMLAYSPSGCKSPDGPSMGRSTITQIGYRRLPQKYEMKVHETVKSKFGNSLWTYEAWGYAGNIWNVLKQRMQHMSQIWHAYIFVLSEFTFSFLVFLLWRLSALRNLTEGPLLVNRL